MPIDSRDLLRRIIEEEKEFRGKDFIAPYTKSSSHAIVPFNKMLYRFGIKGMKGEGLGVFHPVSPSEARFVSDAEYEDVRRYYDALPHLYLILCYQIEQGWVAYPFNMESTTRRFGLASEVVVHGVSDAQRFDVITGRFDGENFWCDDLFAGADPIKADEMREAFGSGITKHSWEGKLQSIKGVTPEDRTAFKLAFEAWDLFRKATTEHRLKELLESGGAKLGSYVLRGQNIEVRWESRSGEGYVSVVNKDTFDVVSAGICLDGEDEKFHIKDLPHIMDQGERQGLIYRTHPHRQLLRNDDDWGYDD